MPTYKVKSQIDAGDGNVYKKGDTIELSEADAFDIRHALKNPPQQDPRMLQMADEDDDDDDDDIDVDASSKEPLARAPRRPDDLKRVDAAGNDGNARRNTSDGVGETPTSKAIDDAAGSQPPSGVGGPTGQVQPQQGSGPSTATGQPSGRPSPQK